MPMTFRITSPFGALEEIRDGKPHTGIDIAMPEGTTLRSIAEGVVERVVDYGRENIGKGVIIRTDDGTRLIYGHMERVDVKPGEHIGVGEIIGLSGNTGHSTGPHLHFGMYRHGEWIDPTPLVEAIGEMSKPDVNKGLLGVVPNIFGGVIEQAKEEAKEAVKEKIITFLEALGEVVLDLSYAITLIGTATLIILRVAGLQQGYRWAGVLFTANALIRLLLGGALR